MYIIIFAIIACFLFYDKLHLVDVEIARKVIENLFDI